MRNRMQQEGYFSHEMVIISASPHLIYRCARTTATQSDSISPLVKVAPWARLLRSQIVIWDGSRCSPLLWLSTILDREMIFQELSLYRARALWGRCFIRHPSSTHLRMFVHTGCPKIYIYIFFTHLISSLNARGNAIENFAFSILHDLQHLDNFKSQIKFLLS